MEAFTRACCSVGFQHFARDHVALHRERCWMLCRLRAQLVFGSVRFGEGSCCRSRTKSAWTWLRNGCINSGMRTWMLWWRIAMILWMRWRQRIEKKFRRISSKRRRKKRNSRHSKQSGMLRGSGLRRCAGLPHPATAGAPPPSQLPAPSPQPPAALAPAPPSPVPQRRA